MKKTVLALALAIGTLAVVIDSEAYPEISTDDLKKAISSKKVTLIDVNGSESWQRGHIPGALNFAVVGKNLATKLPADKKALVVAYCCNERCSAYRQAATAAKDLGYTNVKHYAKGIQGWTALGEATEKGSSK